MLRDTKCYTKQILAIFVSSCCAVSALNAQELCHPTEDTRRSPHELVQSTDAIYLARVIKINPPGEEHNVPYEYIFEVIESLKASGQRILEFNVNGGYPYDDVPQHYLSIDERHNIINYDDVEMFGSNGLYISEGDQCKIYPSFKLGYQYLVFYNSNSRIGYEPINSPLTDNWYKMVKDVLSNPSVSVE